MIDIVKIFVLPPRAIFSLVRYWPRHLSCCYISLVKILFSFSLIVEDSLLEPNRYCQGKVVGRQWLLDPFDLIRMPSFCTGTNASYCCRVDDIFVFLWFWRRFFFLVLVVFKRKIYIEPTFNRIIARKKYRFKFQAKIDKHVRLISDVSQGLHYLWSKFKTNEFTKRIKNEFYQLCTS